MELSKISYYLSYTDWIPIVSIPSGIVHLLLAATEKQNAVQKAPENESLVSLAERVLDDRTHLAKGLLILSVVGTIVIAVEALWRRYHLETVKVFERTPDPRLQFAGYPHGVFPTKLMNNAEFIIAVADWDSSFLKAMTDEQKDDKSLILALIASGKLDDFFLLSPRLQNDYQVALEFVKKQRGVFDQLSYVLKNNIEIIKAAISASGNYLTPKEILQKVPDRNVFKTDENDLLIRAVRYGIFKLNELDPKYRDDRRYAKAALLSDFRDAEIPAVIFQDEDINSIELPKMEQFDLLTEARQRDLDVHTDVLKEFHFKRHQSVYIRWLYEKAKITLFYVNSKDLVPAGIPE